MNLDRTPQNQNSVEKAFSEGKHIVLSETAKQILQRRLAEFQQQKDGGQNNG